jgi:hypothetical protein
VNEIENIIEKTNEMDVNQIEKEKELMKVKYLLDDMLDFLAEMPIDEYHDYREFRHLRLRQYLIHKYIVDKHTFN